MVEAYFRLASRGCHGILYGDRSLGQELEDTVSFFIASSGRREAIIVLLSQQGNAKRTPAVRLSSFRRCCKWWIAGVGCCLMYVCMEFVPKDLFKLVKFELYYRIWWIEL